MTNSLQDNSSQDIYKSYYLDLDLKKGMKNHRFSNSNNTVKRVVPNRQQVWDVSVDASFRIAYKLTNYITKDTTWKDYDRESRKYQFFEPWHQGRCDSTVMDSAISEKNHNVLIGILEKAQKDAQKLQKQLDEIQIESATQPPLDDDEPLVDNDLQKRIKNITIKIALQRNLHMFPGQGEPPFIQVLLDHDFDAADRILEVVGWDGINAEYGDGVSPFRRALEQRDCKIIIWLLSRGATPPPNLSVFEEELIKECEKKRLEIDEKQVFAIDAISTAMYGKQINLDVVNVIRYFVGNIDTGVDVSQLKRTEPKFEEKADEIVQIFTVVSPMNTTLSGVWMEERNRDA